MRGLVQGDYPGLPEADATDAAALAKMLTFMDYVRKAGDELDVALSQYRRVHASDFAEQMARAANAWELSDCAPPLRSAGDARSGWTRPTRCRSS